MVATMHWFLTVKVFADWLLILHPFSQIWMYIQLYNSCFRNTGNGFLVKQITAPKIWLATHLYVDLSSETWVDLFCCSENWSPLWKLWVPELLFFLICETGSASLREGEAGGMKHPSTLRKNHRCCCYALSLATTPKTKTALCFPSAKVICLILGVSTNLPWMRKECLINAVCLIRSLLVSKVLLLSVVCQEGLALMCMSQHGFYSILRCMMLEKKKKPSRSVQIVLVLPLLS